jgi:hypothetical protein
MEPRWKQAIAPSVRPPMIATGAPVRIAFRAYAEPAATIGPADAELTYGRVIVFRPQ